MTGRRRSLAVVSAALLVLVLVVVAVRSRGGDEEGPEAATATSTTSSSTTITAAPGEPAPDASPTTVMADRLAAVTTEAPPPRVALEVRLGGTVSGTAAGDVTARCLRGPDFLDVDVVAEPPLPLGQFGMTSLVFSAPGYKGPGRYDAGAADDEEWTIALVDLETEEPLEFFAPGSGVSGAVTIDPDGRSGSFDIRGLVDVEERTVAVAGRFTCGAVEG